MKIPSNDKRMAHLHLTTSEIYTTYPNLKYILQYIFKIYIVYYTYFFKYFSVQINI